ncbi:hypothetical protein GMRT_11957 [Giardia muris]|uniref:Uncharacterized protein n=1 Tax=Giardia muris TaxID=5742 RepID=A0A4Z1STK2_GIAMU|nr:hypothetical protein GMRT_11957 [Giardia muris]|eukprot:TNJ29214.1 hypothetical protein GMRT_11957 [Giardia muris]
MDTFGAYSHGGVVTEETFILAAISFLGGPPSEDELATIDFSTGLDYSAFSEALGRISRAHPPMKPTLEEIFTVLVEIFGEEEVSVTQFVEILRAVAIQHGVPELTESKLVGVAELAVGETSKNIGMLQLARFLISV